LAPEKPTSFYRERSFRIISNIGRRNDAGRIWEQLGQLATTNSQLANKLFSDAVDAGRLRAQEFAIDR